MDRFMRGNAESISDYGVDLCDGGSNFLFSRALDIMHGPSTIYPAPRHGLRVGESKLSGKGLFCVDDIIYCGEYICYYAGPVRCRESRKSHYCMAVSRDTDIFIHGEKSHFLEHEADDIGKYINSITAWDGSPTGGANVGFFPRYPAWPYVYVQAIRDIHCGEELLADYHWFDTIFIPNACHSSCPHCFPKSRRKKAG